MSRRNAPRVRKTGKAFRRTVRTLNRTELVTETLRAALEQPVPGQLTGGSAVGGAAATVGGRDPWPLNRRTSGSPVDRPWLSAYFMRNTDVQGHSLRLYEKLGQQTLRLDLNPQQRFHAVSAILGVVVGTAADLGAEPPQEVLDGTVNRVEFLNRYAESWRKLDPAQFPFMHEIVDEFAEHDDRDQFLAALEPTLAGLRLQAGTS